MSRTKVPVDVVGESSPSFSTSLCKARMMTNESESSIFRRTRMESGPLHERKRNVPIGLSLSASASFVSASASLSEDVLDDNDGCEDNDEKRGCKTPRGQRPERQRISSEGEVHRLRRSHSYGYDDFDDDDCDDDYDTDHEDNMNDGNHNNNKIKLGEHPGPEFSVSPFRRKTGPLTPCALALKHGASLTIPQRRPLAGRLFPTTKTTPANNQKNQNISLRIRKTNSGISHDKTRKTKTLRQQQKHKQKQAQYANPWLIPIHHPLKVAWDVVTVVLSIVNVILTHRAIRDRKYGHGPGWIEAWFIVDILLNFATQRTNGETILKSFTAVASRYLTSWFVIDVLALFPGELLYIQPVIELQQRRNMWDKLFRRTKVTIKVTTTILQSGHVPWLYKIVVKARPLREGIKLIRLLITYIPKYLLFVRQMKGVIVLRMLRDFGHFCTLARVASLRHHYYSWRNHPHLIKKNDNHNDDDDDDDTVEITSEDDDIDDWERSQDDDPHYDDDVGPF